MTLLLLSSIGVRNLFLNIMIIVRVVIYVLVPILLISIDFVFARTPKKDVVLTSSFCYFVA